MFNGCTYLTGFNATLSVNLVGKRIRVLKRLPTVRQNICGIYVRRARIAYGKRHRCTLTQADLAVKLQLKGLVDFERITVCRIECGRRQVSDVEMKYLALALEVSLNYLMYGREDQLPTFDDAEDIVAENE